MEAGLRLGWASKVPSVSNWSGHSLFGSYRCRPLGLREGKAPPYPRSSTLALIPDGLCSFLRVFSSRRTERNFPGGPVVKNLPSNAGDMGSIPGRGTKIPHAGTTKPVSHNYWACVLWSLCSAKRSLHATVKTQHSQKKRKRKRKKGGSHLERIR